MVSDRLIVDPSAKPVPLVAELVDEGYQVVANVTLPEMSWPGYLRYRGRIFVIYYQTVPFVLPDEAARTQLYREVEVFDV